METKKANVTKEEIKDYNFLSLILSKSGRKQAKYLKKKKTL